MGKIRNINTPRLYRLKWLVSCMAVIFTLALASSLVSLPFSSRQNRSALLNTVEEEAAAGSSNNINEEHKSGKSLHAHFLDLSEILGAQNTVANVFEIPRAVDIISSLHIRRIIQPPENGIVFA